jgi:hypothetical protein
MSNTRMSVGWAQKISALKTAAHQQFGIGYNNAMMS